MPDVAGDNSYTVMASPDIITLVHCGNKPLSLVTSYQTNFAHTWVSLVIMMVGCLCQVYFVRGNYHSDIS